MSIVIHLLNDKDLFLAVEVQQTEVWELAIFGTQYLRCQLSFWATRKNVDYSVQKVNFCSGSYVVYICFSLLNSFICRRESVSNFFEKTSLDGRRAYFKNHSWRINLMFYYLVLFEFWSRFSKVTTRYPTKNWKVSNLAIVSKNM